MLAAQAGTRRSAAGSLLGLMGYTQNPALQSQG